MGMYFIPKWYEDPESLDPDKNEDLVQAVDAIDHCVQIVRSLIKVDDQTFDAARFLKEFNALRQVLPVTTRLLVPLEWELDPIAAVHGAAQVGEVTGGNHLWAARLWVVRYYMCVLAWTSDYERAMNDINAPYFTVEAFEWARERILAVPKTMAPVDWVAWRVRAEQEVRAAIAKRNELRARGIDPPIVPYGCSGPAPVVHVRQCKSFVGTPLQTKIYKALEGRALKKQELANEVCGGEGTRLYKRGGIKEMMERGIVCNSRGLGYYRQDAPPLANVIPDGNQSGTK